MVDLKRATLVASLLLAAAARVAAADLDFVYQYTGYAQTDPLFDEYSRNGYPYGFGSGKLNNGVSPAYAADLHPQWVGWATSTAAEVPTIEVSLGASRPVSSVGLWLLRKDALGYHLPTYIEVSDATSSVGVPISPSAVADGGGGWIDIPLPAGTNFATFDITLFYNSGPAGYTVAGEVRVRDASADPPSPAAPPSADRLLPFQYHHMVAPNATYGDDPARSTSFGSGDLNDSVIPGFWLTGSTPWVGFDGPTGAAVDIDLGAAPKPVDKIAVWLQRASLNGIALPTRIEVSAAGNVIAALDVPATAVPDHTPTNPGTGWVFVPLPEATTLQSFRVTLSTSSLIFVGEIGVVKPAAVQYRYPDGLPPNGAFPDVPARSTSFGPGDLNDGVTPGYWLSNSAPWVGFECCAAGPAQIDVVLDEPKAVSSVGVWLQRASVNGIYLPATIEVSAAGDTIATLALPASAVADYDGTNPGVGWVNVPLPADTTLGSFRISLAHPSAPAPADWIFIGEIRVRKPQTITFAVLDNKVYGDAPFVLSATSSGLPPTFSIFSGPAAITGNTLTITGAGSVTVRASQAGNEDYDAATPVDRTFTVNAKPASVTPDAASKTYGQVDPGLTGTLSGFLSGDHVTATYSRTTGQTVAGSPYTISATLTPAGGLANYDVTYATASFTIDPAPLTVTANDATRAFGAANPTFTGTITGIQRADPITATYATAATPASTPGTYPIVPTLVDPSSRLGNYAVTSVNGTLTVDDGIFKDGFENGSLAGWSSAVTDSGDLAVTNAAAIRGLTGLAGTVNDVNPLYVQDDSPAGESHYRARFYFDPQGFDTGEAQGHHRTRTFIVFSQAPLRRVAAVVLKSQGGTLSLGVRARLDDNSQADTPFLTLAAGPHAIEIDLVRATGSATANGRLEFWLDGVSVSALTGLQNNRAVVDFVRLGALSVKSGAAGTMYWDEFESRREPYIGLLP